MPSISLDFETTPLARPRRLSESVATRIQMLIGEQRLQRGHKLPAERDLAAALGVSRTALREGIRILEGLHLVEIQHGRGTFVLQPQHLPLDHLSRLDATDRLLQLRQATQARRCVDVEAARQAATIASSEQLRRIAHRLDVAESAAEITRRQFSLDLEFEQLLAEVTGNHYLVATQHLVHELFKGAWDAAGCIPRPAQVRNQQHRAIFEAVAEGNVALAVRRMEKHLTPESLLRPERMRARKDIQ